ncbi:MAG: TonB-dependent receptor plug domain-containing protein [Spirochaetales bacterium]|nr:TonB-dependent receptor plug domain-containing protein [Spirochaetales bacterium]
MKKQVFIFLIFITAVFQLSALQLDILVLDRDLEIPLEGVRLVDTYTGAEEYTDAEGHALFPVDDSREQLILVAELIGYEDSRIRVADFKQKLVVRMVMEGVLEGQELVVEEEAIGESDEEVGVSIALDDELVESAAKIGVFEDALTALAILPGVVPLSSFGNYFSVRGGDPSGMVVLLDGVQINYPYHLGGLLSIFNPNIIDSMKFSPGIFSVKYGQATSGILEITTINPNEGFRIEAVSSTSTLELFVQSPLDKHNKSGVFAGARLTKFDLAFALVEWYAEEAGDEVLQEMTDSVTTVPYVRDFYFKAFYNPGDSLKWYLSAFYGNDGFGMGDDNSDADTSEQIVSDFDTFFYNSDLILNTGLKILPVQNLLIEVILGYEYYESSISYYVREHGTRMYSEEFIEQYAPPDISFTIDAVSDYDAETIKQSMTARVDFDLALRDNYLLQWGLGCSPNYTDFSGGGQLWMLSYDAGFPQYQLFSYEPTETASWIIDSFAYANFNAWFVPEVFKMDLGCRIDHSYFYSEDDFSVNTIPAVSPRLNLTFSPKGGGAFFRKNTFSAGVGLFTRNPFSTNPLSEEMSVEDLEIAIPKTLMTLLGWETDLPAGFNFKIEGYYKYLFDRFYLNLVDAGDGTAEFLTHNDGYGHSLGFDLMVRRRISRKLFGMLSYTFNYTRMRYPETDGLDPETSLRDIWIYPYYHQFHTLNFFLDIKPVNSMTISTKLTFASGTPRNETGESEMFPAFIQNDDGSVTLAEMYMQPYYYSDVLRNNISVKLDLKVGLNNYYKKSKVSWEMYIALENLLAPLMGSLFPPPDSYLDKWGNVVDPSAASFDIPIPSIGLKISY